ncbi:hypothetical protein B0H66DRAFT_547408 [Apodospora peruviana]|uniref:DUF8212 domain-containing protein n=1 Tax=Apodospora peruviana TaxID=516989 RepID=A0AAE0MBM7_9PEZI|nr:hypothetical protein B0H66DRAFT_547408 [Apodospora peruviana]
MFRWYEKAAVCYVFLADLAPGDDLGSALPKCRWFTRGWTLQELIAPQNEVLFYDGEWNYAGSRSQLAGLIASITGIPEALLQHQVPLSEFAVARRLSWASRRETTRLEDMAYCLLGLFDVHMSLIYGERTRAFARLQEAIIQATGDLSIFAWTTDDRPCPEYAGFFAESPRQFRSCANIETNREDSIYRDVKITTRGIQMEASMVHLHLNGVPHQPVLNLLCTMDDTSVGLYLRKIGGNRYARWYPGLAVQFEQRQRVSRDQAIYAPVRYEQEIVPQSSPPLYWRGHIPMIETVFLPTRLPDTFPFHPSNPVLGNRNSALRLNVKDGNRPGGMRLKIERLTTLPWSHWDRHDRVFFCTNRLSRSWSAALIHGWAKNAPRPGIEISLFVACFFWNPAEPEAYIADIDSIPREAAAMLELNLSKVRFESANEAQMMIQGTFGNKLLSYPGPPLPIHGERVKAQVEMDLHYEMCPNLCDVNLTTYLDILVSLDEERGVKEPEERRPNGNDQGSCSAM